MNRSATLDRLFDLSGQVALVTGATGHLGQAICEALAEAGAAVLAASSKEIERARDVCNQLPSPSGAQHSAVLLDQMNEASCESGFAGAVEAAGKVDILVNNGLEPCGEDLNTVTHDQFARHQVNNAGYFYLARKLRDHVVADRRAGNILMVGSMYGQVGSYPETYEGVCAASSAAYHALKGGTIHLTRHLAVYWATDKVRVNCLSPGPFPNPEKVPPELVARLCTKSPMKRMGEPHELKGAVVFLTSSASSYVTGHNLNVDGGWTAW